MNGPIGNVVRVVLALIVLYVIWKAALFVIHGIFALAVPILVVGAVYLLVTRTRAGRALIGGRRSLP